MPNDHRSTPEQAPEQSSHKEDIETESTFTNEFGDAFSARPVLPELFLLVKRASELEEVMQFAQGAAKPGSHSPVSWLEALRSPISGEKPQEIARRWSSMFADEITTVRLVRNSIVHNRPISYEDAQSALEIADHILSVIKQSADAVAPSSRHGSTSDGPETTQADQQAE